jgi:G3E family GTPase
LHRLQLTEGYARFGLKIATAGLYVAYEQHGEIAFHIEVAGDTVKPAWQQDYAPAHTHNDAVTSVGITTTGDLDGKRLNDWIGQLLKTKGGDIFRCKGVLAVKGSPNRMVFQGVHMLFDAKFDTPWGSAPRTNTLVFIGKNLDRTALNEGFKACLV